MYQTLVPLKASEHRGLSFSPCAHYQFAAAEVVAPILIEEIVDVAHEYPIVFPLSSRQPVALLGLQRGRNVYVTSTGEWLAHYIPLSIRNYPLVSRSIKSSSEGQPPSYAVFFDPTAPHFSAADGALCFTPEGEPTSAFQRRLNQLQYYQQKALNTELLVDRLAESGLLVHRTVTIHDGNTSTSQLTGVRVVDEERLRELSDSHFCALRASGLLPVIYAHLFSLVNLRRGPLAGCYPQSHFQAEARTSWDSSDDSLTNWSS